MKSNTNNVNSLHLKINLHSHEFEIVVLGLSPVMPLCTDRLPLHSAALPNSGTNYPGSAGKYFS